MRSFSSPLKSRSPAWNMLRRKALSRLGSKGALRRRMATRPLRRARPPRRTAAAAGGVDAFDVDARPAAAAAGAFAAGAAVLEQHDRLALRQLAGLRGRPALPTMRSAASEIEIGIVEQTQAELVAQQAADGLVDARLADLAAAHQLDDHLRAGLAAELVDAGFERFQDALSAG